jgi:hypothetical protein
VNSLFQAFRISGLLFAVLLLASCAAAVATQKIPLSTDPSGARVFADGTPACVTPCTVELARNQDHLLTFQKEGFHQQDVAVRRQHQTEMSLLNAINSGVNSASFFNNPVWGLSSAVQSLTAQQATGEAYILLPSTVSLHLVPEGGFPRTATGEEAVRSLGRGESPLDLMDATDEHMIEVTLETSKTGKTTLWTNSRTGIAFAVEPEDARTVDGAVTRVVRVGARKGGEDITARVEARRVGDGEWIVGDSSAPPPSSATTDSPPAPDPAGAVRALAQSPWPSVKKDWKVQESSHASTSRNADGSVTTTTEGTSTKVGVSIGPGAVLGILDALKSLENRGKPEQEP